MKDPIRINLTPNQAAIVAELFSDGDTKAIAELLGLLPQPERHLLAGIIRAEIARNKLNVATARAFLDSQNRLHIMEPEK